jgi:hypothetical protein
MVMSAGADPQIGLSASEITFPMPANLNNITIDTGLVEMPASRIKSLAIVVTSAITFGASQTGTVQLFAARSKYGTLGGDTATTPGGPIGVTLPSVPFVGSSGATAGFPTGNVPNTSQLVGVAVPIFTPGGTSFGPGIFWATSTSPGTPGLGATASTSLTELAQWYPVLGVQVVFSGTPTGGAWSVVMEVAPI